MKIKDLFAVVHINLLTNKAILNDKAEKIFKDKKKISDIVKQIDFNKKIDFCYIDEKLYVINIIKGGNDIYLLFSEVEDDSIVLNKLQTERGIDIEVYQRDAIREFLEKFLALKKRYGGFNIKFLYLKIDFTRKLALDIKHNILHQILKYTISVTRSSDVVGQISENSFGIILTNSTKDGVNVVVNKVLKYISELNLQSSQKVVEVYAALAHEMYILKHTNFDELVSLLDENVEFINVGMKLKELI